MSRCNVGIVPCNKVRDATLNEGHILLHATLSGRLVFYFDDCSMDMIKRAVSNVNGSQVPVIAMDQPLSAKATLIQWAWPEKYDETQLVFVFGSLHIEQTFMRVFGLNTVDGKVCWYKMVFMQKAKIMPASKFPTLRKLLICFK